MITLAARRARRRPRPVRAALVACLALGVLAAACGGSTGAGGAEQSAGSDPQGGAVGTGDEPTAEPRLPVTVSSADGRTITVTDVGRIVPLVGSISEVVFALGLGDRVVGRDISATFEEAADLPLVTRAHDVSAESVLSLRPTLVLADGDTGPPEALDHIRNVGVPVVVIDRATTVEGIGERIRTIAEVLGVPGQGDELIAETEAEIAAETDAIPDGEQPRVAFVYARGQAAVYLIGGPGAGTDSLIEAAGAIDAGTAMDLSDPYTPLTSEAMVEAAPDAILMTTTGLESVGGIDGLLALPGIAQTPAGRDRRVVTIEDGLLFSFSGRTPEALAQLIGQLYGS